MAPSEDEKKVEWQYLPLTPLQDREPRARDGIRNSLGPVEDENPGHPGNIQQPPIINGP